MTNRTTRLHTYVLITAARNEAAFIELTLRSVIAQTSRPARWIIVSDGSTDGTDELVKRYAAKHKWIELLRMPDRAERHFAGKAAAINTAYRKLKALDFELVGNLDGDVSFEPEFFSFLLRKFARNPRLGVAGTPFIESDAVAYDYRFVSAEHVSGQVQLFRRECFEGIGGYVAAKRGGIDLIAVTTARMLGWRTRTFKEKVFRHHRPMGSATHNPILRKWMLGIKDYSLGSDPVWEFLRGIYQMGKKPFLLGGFMILAGYSWSAICLSSRPVSRDFVKFRRREQMLRLKHKLKAMLPGRAAVSSDSPPQPVPVPTATKRAPMFASE